MENVIEAMKVCSGFLAKEEKRCQLMKIDYVDRKRWTQDLEKAREAFNRIVRFHSSLCSLLEIEK